MIPYELIFKIADINRLESQFKSLKEKMAGKKPKAFAAQKYSPGGCQSYGLSKKIRVEAWGLNGTAQALKK